MAFNTLKMVSKRGWAFTAESSLFGNLRHPLASGNVPDGSKKQRRIIRFVDQVQIFGDDFFVVEVFGNV